MNRHHLSHVRVSVIPHAFQELNRLPIPADALKRLRRPELELSAPARVLPCKLDGFLEHRVGRVVLPFPHVNDCFLIKHLKSEARYRLQSNEASNMAVRDPHGSPSVDWP